MKTLEIITAVNTFLKTENKEILTDLINALQVEYRHEETKRKGGNSALKRQKLIEKLLKQNKKNVPEARKQLYKLWYEEINGEQMQIYTNMYYIIALNRGNFVDVETETDAEKINFKVEGFLTEKSNHDLTEMEVDICDIKQTIESFKAEQKQLPVKQRGGNAFYDVGNCRFNAEYLLNCIEALGNNVKFYVNEISVKPSYLSGEAGECMILPCRKDS